MGLIGLLPLLAVMAIGVFRTVSRLRVALVVPARARHARGPARGVHVRRGLTAINVALENPYLGLFFWTPLALMIVLPTLPARPRRSSPDKECRRTFPRRAGAGFRHARRVAPPFSARRSTRARRAGPASPAPARRDRSPPARGGRRRRDRLRADARDAARGHGGRPRVSRLAWGLLTLPAWILVFKAYGLYDRDGKRVSHSTVDDVPWLFHALVIGSLGLWALLPASRRPIR